MDLLKGFTDKQAPALAKTWFKLNSKICDFLEKFLGVKFLY